MQQKKTMSAESNSVYKFKTFIANPLTNINIFCFPLVTPFILKKLFLLALLFALDESALPMKLFKPVLLNSFHTFSKEGITLNSSKNKFKELLISLAILLHKPNPKLITLIVSLLSLPTIPLFLLFLPFSKNT